MSFSYSVKPDWSWAYNKNLISAGENGWVYANPNTGVNELLVAMKNFAANTGANDALVVDNNTELNVANNPTDEVEFLNVDDPDAEVNS